MAQQPDRGKQLQNGFQAFFLPILMSCKPAEADGYVQRLTEVGPQSRGPGRLLLVGPASMTIPVRIVDPTKFKQEEMKSTMTGAAWDFLMGVITLKAGYRRDDMAQIREAYRKITPAMFPPEDKDIAAVSARSLSSSHREAGRNLAGTISADLRRAELVYWGVGKYEKEPPPSKGRDFQPGIFCPDYQTAIAVRLVLCKSVPVRVCPYCHESFEPRRPNHIFDKEKCRGAYRLARWRKKQERKNRRKKR